MDEPNPWGPLGAFQYAMRARAYLRRTMSIVRVTFDYTPDDPDDDDPTGMSSEEFDRLSDALVMEWGADDIKVERVTP